MLSLGFNELVGLLNPFDCYSMQERIFDVLLTIMICF
jgi:hypothetical protein